MATKDLYTLQISKDVATISNAQKPKHPLEYLQDKI